MTIAHTHGFWTRRAVIGTVGAPGIARRFYLTTLQRWLARGRGIAAALRWTPRDRTSRHRLRAAEPHYVRALLAELVEVQRRKVPGIAPHLLGRVGGRPAARALVDDPDGQRARRRRSREQQWPVRCRRSPRQRFDLSVQWLHAHRLVVLARLPEVDHAVAVSGREEVGAGPEGDRGREAGRTDQPYGRRGHRRVAGEVPHHHVGAVGRREQLTVAAPAERARLERRPGEDGVVPLREAPDVHV